MASGMPISQKSTEWSPQAARRAPNHRRTVRISCNFHRACDWQTGYHANSLLTGFAHYSHFLLCLDLGGDKAQAGFDASRKVKRKQ